ncbi:hypothetical protein VoSk93_46930 [Vibrio owensii]
MVLAHKIRIFRKIQLVINAVYLKIKFIYFVVYCDLDLVFSSQSISVCYGFDKNKTEDGQTLMLMPYVEMA